MNLRDALICLANGHVVRPTNVSGEVKEYVLGKDGYLRTRDGSFDKDAFELPTNFDEWEVLSTDKITFSRKTLEQFICRSMSQDIRVTPRQFIQNNKYRHLYKEEESWSLKPLYESPQSKGGTEDEAEVETPKKKDECTQYMGKVSLSQFKSVIFTAIDRVMCKVGKNIGDTEVIEIVHKVLDDFKIEDRSRKEGYVPSE